MKGKTKLILGGFGFLGANGVAWPILNNSYELFKNIKDFSWGGQQL
ncbi:hypothetical protein OVS_04025 [Mycoplasma ovis str. Michigan]|uniref:Uncharacterized protein n=1 Tax=Mycoplasma ovis str. Michigan TaxID=1415773 RepID=A0ABM5P2G2_9MOLU|nr:hypothetical protein [Mycoplasma ovis]AHC40536.1 hypothetical protein OVS_04025 [Mycoplasma ovis str. Michigan]